MGTQGEVLGGALQMKKTKPKRAKKYTGLFSKKSRQEALIEQQQRIACYMQSVSMRKEEINVDKANGLVLGLIAALENILAGKGTDSDAALIGGHFNMTSKMVDANLGGSGDYADVVNAARAALIDMTERHDRTKRWGLTGEGIQAVRQMIELRDALLNCEENSVGVEAAFAQAIDRDVEAGHVERAWEAA